MASTIPPTLRSHQLLLHRFLNQKFLNNLVTWMAPALLKSRPVPCFPGIPGIHFPMITSSILGATFLSQLERWPKIRYLANGQWSWMYWACVTGAPLLVELMWKALYDLRWFFVSAEGLVQEKGWSGAFCSVISLGEIMSRILPSFGGFWLVRLSLRCCLQGLLRPSSRNCIGRHACALLPYFKFSTKCVFCLGFSHQSS